MTDLLERLPGDLWLSGYPPALADGPGLAGDPRPAVDVRGQRDQSGREHAPGTC